MIRRQVYMMARAYEFPRTGVRATSFSLARGAYASGVQARALMELSDNWRNKGQDDDDAPGKNTLSCYEPAHIPSRLVSKFSADGYTTMPLVRDDIVMMTSRADGRRVGDDFDIPEFSDSGLPRLLGQESGVILGLMA